LPDEKPNPEFMLNYPRYKGGSVLIARANFGCGSSREHAPWAILDYGFHVVLAPSYADIFYNNCFKNGILPATLSSDQIEELFKRTQQNEGYRLTVDLEQQVVTDDQGLRYSFEIDPFRKDCLLRGLDDIGLTLVHEPEISAYEKKNLHVPVMNAPLDVKYHQS
jgi:3-isopropylmalate/(R)-2-methylmalate dehydratase small subunit